MYILPQPREQQMTDSYFLLDYTAYLAVDPACSGKIHRQAFLLRDAIEKNTGYCLHLTRGEARKGDIQIGYLDCDKGEQYYELSITPEGVTIRGTETSIFYGMQTLSLIHIFLRNPDFTWKLKNELEFLKNYMDMMEIRYGNTMDYQWEYEENLEEEIIPRFILQPVIENCFVHGGSNIEVRRIVLRIKKKEQFYIEVQNTGVKVDAEKIQQINQGIKKQENTGTHIGLANVYKRIKLLYGEKGDVFIESNEEGFFVRIVF